MELRMERFSGAVTLSWIWICPERNCWRNNSISNCGLPGLLSWSKVADPTGQNQESYTFLGQTVGPPNAYPFFDLGVVPTGVSTNFPLDFHFSWATAALEHQVRTSGLTKPLPRILPPLLSQALY